MEMSLKFLSEQISQIILEKRLTNGKVSCIIILERTFVHEHMNENEFGGGFIYGKYRED